MSRTRTPTNILELRGVRKNHPERLKERETEPVDDRGIGDPPENLSESELVCWNDLVADCIPGVLTRCDRHSVMVAARILAKFKIDEATVAEVGQLIKLLGQFGMTPSERSKIKMPNKKTKNEFDED